MKSILSWPVCKSLLVTQIVGIHWSCCSLDHIFVYMLPLTQCSLQNPGSVYLFLQSHSTLLTVLMYCDWHVCKLLTMVLWGHKAYMAVFRPTALQRSSLKKQHQQPGMSVNEPPDDFRWALQHFLKNPRHLDQRKTHHDSYINICPTQMWNVKWFLSF
jgi:hypothetical protein